MERRIPPEQLLAEAKRIIAEVEAQNPHLRTSPQMISDSIAHAYSQSSQYLHQLQVTRTQIKAIEQDVIRERNQHQREVAGLLLENKKLADEANRQKDLAHQYQHELARYQPDPNDARDWSGDSFWQGQGEMSIPPMNSASLALEDKQREPEHLSRMDALWDFCDHPVIRLGGFAIIAFGYALAMHFHF